MTVLLTERHGRITELTLNRPEAGNAFNAELYGALAGALRDAAGDPDVRCVVLGATGRLFSAGADLADLADALSGRTTDAQRAYDRLLIEAETFPKPLIAAVGGPAVGIGFTLLGHADIVLVADAARFSAPFARIGLVPEGGSTATFPARLGPQVTAHLLLSGAWLSAQDAVAYGFALRRVPADRLRTEALDLADQIAAQPLDSLVETKRLIAAARGTDPEAARAREDAAFVAALTRAETAELMRAALRTVTTGKAKA